MTKALSHLHRIGVLPADIDFMGHVNNARYLNWVQDAVLAHWNKLAPPETAAKYLWVALKHEITYRKPAFLDDDVIATVVLEKVQGGFATGINLQSGSQLRLQLGGLPTGNNVTGMFIFLVGDCVVEIAERGCSWYT